MRKEHCSHFRQFSHHPPKKNVSIKIPFNIMDLYQLSELFMPTVCAFSCFKDK